MQKQLWKTVGFLAAITGDFNRRGPKQARRHNRGYPIRIHRRKPHIPRGTLHRHTLERDDSPDIQSS
jgi:hypothetical protein